MAELEYNINTPDSRDIEVLFSRIGTEWWKGLRDKTKLAEKFDVNISVVNDAIKYYLWLYPNHK